MSTSNGREDPVCIYCYISRINPLILDQIGKGVLKSKETSIQSVCKVRTVLGTEVGSDF